MSLYKFAAGLAALALSAAVVTALAGVRPEVKAGLAAQAQAAAPDTKAAVPELQTAAASGAERADTPQDRASAAVKADRPAARPAKGGDSSVKSAVKWACPREPWPYGCQWREPPARKVVIRGSRPS